MSETPDETISRLHSKRPEWRPDRRHPHMSVTGESRASYEQRLAAWESALTRAQELKREQG